MPHFCLSYPSRHIVSQHSHLHPSEWVPRGHRCRQNRQHSKNGRKVHELHKCSSHSAQTNPMESGPGNTFSAKNRKKKKKQKIPDFRPPKRGTGSFFSTFLNPPPHVAQNLRKVGFKWGVGLGGPTRNSLGDAYIGHNNDFTRGETIQPLEVGYANSPKKAPKGGYVAFSPIYGPAWLLSNNLHEGIVSFLWTF